MGRASKTIAIIMLCIFLNRALISIFRIHIIMFPNIKMLVKTSRSIIDRFLFHGVRVWIAEAFLKCIHELYELQEDIPEVKNCIML